MGGIESTGLASIERAGTTVIEQTLVRHLAVSELCAELGISKSTFYDWRAARRAPCCIKLPHGGLRVRRDRPRIFRTASNRAFYAAVLLFRYSLWTSCGVR
jgi:predicted DNA-binding transcriptional regulator AlpA